jgi:hypothetical protein
LLSNQYIQVKMIYKNSLKIPRISPDAVNRISPKEER